LQHSVLFRNGKCPFPAEPLHVNPRVVAALVTAVATILAAALGSLVTLRAIQESNLETYDLAVNLTKYPFEKTSIEIQEGDEVEIVVLGANSTILNCGIEDTTILGMLSSDYQSDAILPTANLCSLVGHIGPESAPYFSIGAYAKFESSISGPLSLGVNDIRPERCYGGTVDCFGDNTGTVFLKLTIKRK
jgi:hypothetical protein